MLEKMSIPSIKVRFEGLFDFDGMYAAINDWGKNYNYLFHEKAYKHKVPSPKGAEKEFEWVLTKKITEDAKYEIKIDAHIWDLKEIEVKTHQGKKLNLEEKRSVLTEIQERESQINIILDEYSSMENKQSRTDYIDILRQEYKRLSKELHEIHILVTKLKK